MEPWDIQYGQSPYLGGMEQTSVPAAVGGQMDDNRPGALKKLRYRNMLEALLSEEQPEMPQRPPMEEMRFRDYLAVALNPRMAPMIQQRLYAPQQDYEARVGDYDRGMQRRQQRASGLEALLGLDQPDYAPVSPGSSMFDKRSGTFGPTAPGTPYNQRPQGMMNISPGGVAFDPATKTEVYRNPATPKAPKADRYSPPAGAAGMMRDGIVPVAPDHPQYSYWKDATEKTSAKRYSEQIQSEARKIKEDRYNMILDNQLPGQTPTQAQLNEAERISDDAYKAYLKQHDTGMAPSRPTTGSPALDALRDQIDTLEEQLRAAGMPEDQIDQIIEQQFGAALEQAGHQATGQR